ncbi:MAG: hypothetical protein ACKOW3_02145 [Hyphomicrobium sp.]
MRAIRFLATLLFLVATLSFLSDLTPTVYDHAPFKATPLEDHWQMLSPKTLTNFKEVLLLQVSQNFLRNVEKYLFKLPTFLLFGSLGLLLAFLGRRRNKIKVFIN